MTGGVFSRPLAPILEGPKIALMGEPVKRLPEQVTEIVSAIH